MEVTGTNLLRLKDAAEKAVDAAGTGEMRGVKLLMELHKLGADLILVDPPAAPRLALAAPVEAETATRSEAA